MLFSGKELGQGGHFYRSIGRTASKDGINWDKDDINPIITYVSNDEWNQFLTVAGVFIRKEEEYMVWFSGVGSRSRWNIGFLKAKGICL